MTRVAMMARLAGGLMLLSLLLAGCAAPRQLSLAGVPGGSSDMTLAIDGAQHFQTIDGFGVNANSLPWDNGTLAPALGQLTNTLGAAVWRVIVESKEGWDETPDTGNPFTYNWSYYDHLYETPKFQALWGVLGYLQQKHVPTIMLNVMGCAPEWMGGCAIDPGHEDYYVRMEASLLYYARTVKHLRIDILSPMNEEDAGNPEGPRVSSAQYVRILDKLSERLDTLGLGDIQLLGPDTASVGVATSDYMPALLDDATLMAKIYHFGLHNYGGGSGSVADVIAHSAYTNRDFWMTEYSAWCDGCDNGAPNPNNWDFAAQTLNYLLNFIEQGASSALVYDGYDSYYEHHGHMGYWGLLAYNAAAKSYTPRKRFYTVAQVVRFARPGMVRIGAQSSDDAVDVVAFTDPKTGALTIVGRNPNSTAATIHGTLANIPTPLTLALYQTTTTLNMARGADVPVSRGAFTAEIAPDSVFTLTSLPQTGTAAAITIPTAVPVAPTATDQAMAGPLTLGNTAVGPQIDSGDANYANGSRFITGARGGTVTSMSVHVGNVSAAPNNQYELAIYTDHGGRPDRLVARSGRGTLSANAWNTLAMRATLSPNTAYWLMYNTNGADSTSNNMTFAPGDGVLQAYSAQSMPFGEWPGTFGSAVVSPAGAFSIYATYGLAAATPPSTTLSIWTVMFLLMGIVVLTAAITTGVLIARHRPVRLRDALGRLR